MVKRKTISFDDKLEELQELASDRKKEKIISIPTGSISLDVSIGIGGIPQGRFTEIYGSESSGKTTLALSICKNALKYAYRILYIDAEQGLDESFIDRLVGEHDKKQLTIFRPETMEQAMQLAELAIQSKEFGLVVLDSIGSLAPKKVKEDELSDANVALLARMMTTFVQRNAYDLRYSNTAFVGINQVRDKIGAYHPTFETPGGHTWKHQASLRIQLSRVEDIIAGDEKIGIITKFVIKKNKLAPPFRTFTFPIIFGKGVDTSRDLVEFAQLLGVLEKGGAYFRFEGATLAQGVANMVEYLDTHPETLDKIVKQCYSITNIKTIIESEDEDEQGIVS